MEKLLAVLLVDLDIVHRDQHAPGVILGRGILLELHDLIVNRGRSADRELAQIHRQVILRLNGIRSSVGRLLHKFQAFQAKARRVCDVVRAIGDELTKRRLPIGGVGAVRRRGRRERPIPPRDHAEILILQCKRPAVQHALLHGIARRPYVPHIGKHLRGKRTKQSVNKRDNVFFTVLFPPWFLCCFSFFLCSCSLAAPHMPFDASSLWFV